MNSSHEDYKGKYHRSKLLNIIFISVILGVVIGGTFSFGMFGNIDEINSQPANASDTISTDISNMQKEIQKIQDEIEKIQNNTQYGSPVISVAEEVLPSIVMVRNKVKMNPYLRYGEGGSVNLGTGSGIIYREDGYVITNQHVINGASEIEVVLNDGRVFSARILGEDSRSDLAVLKIEADNLKAAKFGDSGNVKVGEIAVAIGTPAGEEFSGSVTAGIISALNRSINIGEKKFNLIQTDAAINPGNSGGALVNSNGEVIGINSIKLSSPNIEGMGFAIPINSAVPIIEELIIHGYIKRPWIGIMLETMTEERAQIYNVPKGVYIIRVYHDSPAAQAQLQVNDIITEIDGVTINTAQDLIKIVENHEPDDVIELKIYRGESYIKVNVKLGVMPPN